MKRKLFSALALSLALSGYAQQNLWSSAPKNMRENLKPRWTKPNEFALYSLDVSKMKNELKNAPMRLSGNESLTVKFPAADGSIKEYIVQEAPIMEEGLQNQFPDIRSYVGWQKNHPENSIRFSITPETGINIMYFDGWEISYLDPYTQDHSTYIFYKRKDLPKNDRLFECHVEDAIDAASKNESGKAALVTDGFLRKYRLALAATGEYTTFHGGVNGAMNAMNVTMTRVNGVYEKTISSTMMLIANNSQLIYTNAATDPYTNSDGGAMLTENINTINSVIGSSNYDIGHVFSTGGGGVAYLGSICTTSKAGGVTGSGAPIGDPFDIDYVAHEIGHQFGGNHTFRANTGSCQGNANSATAFEPGSGSTIMAYAGICGSSNNVQSNSDAYFHAVNVAEMYTVITRPTDCSVKTANNNLVPTANAGADYIIPKGTAFVLTGVGTDPNNDPLT